MAIRVIVLTGSRKGPNPLLEGSGVSNKALLPVGGVPMVFSVLQNAAKSRYQPMLYVSTSDPEVMAFSAQVPFDVITPGERAVQSFLSALDAVPGDEPILVISGDHPLLTPEMIDYFLDQALPMHLGLAIGMVSQHVVEAEYPGARRSFFKVKGGGFSGANLLLVRKERFKILPEIFELIDSRRKERWKLIPKLGIKTLIEYALMRLDIHEVLRRASASVGFTADVIEMPFAEACIDVDKPEDKVLVEQILEARRQALQVIQPVPEAIQPVKVIDSDSETPIKAQAV